MFPLDGLHKSAHAFQIAGRFGVEVMGLLYPTRTIAEGDRIRLIPPAALSGSTDLPTLFDRSVQTPVSRAALRHQVLVYRAQGEFVSTDEFTLAQIRRDQGNWRIEIVIIRREDQDGEAAPRDLYLVLCVEVGNHPLRRLELQLSRRSRDFKGNDTSLTAPVVVTQQIEVTD